MNDLIAVVDRLDAEYRPKMGRGPHELLSLRDFIGKDDLFVELLDWPKTLPTLDSLDLPPHEAAETYMKSGESFLSRVLPYWAMRLVVQLKIFLLPLILVWVPAFKLVPLLYQMRINMLLKRHYTELREVETTLLQATTPEELRQRLQALDALRKNMERVSRKVPGLYQRDVYHWRQHVALVRSEGLERLERLEARATPVPVV